MTHACFIDSDQGEAECVFDDGDLDRCDVAPGLSRSGLCKKDCQYWKNIDGQKESFVRFKLQEKTKNQIKVDAAKMNSERVQNQIAVDLYTSGNAPDFNGSFGHGKFTRKA